MAREERGRCSLVNLLIQKLGISDSVHCVSIERERAYDWKTKVKARDRFSLISSQ